jgi:hypothetical protein
VNLVIAPKAYEQIEQARNWWAQNRDKGPEVFREELAAVLDGIVLRPRTGQRVILATGQMVFRVLMPKSGRQFTTK